MTVPAAWLGARRVVVWVPDWPVAAAVAEGLAAAHEPVAVHDAHGILVCSAQARHYGVRRGMRRRSAQGLCPELVLLAADESRDARSFEPVVQAVETVAAGAEVLRPGVVLLPARGPSRHAGSEERLAELLVGAVAEESGTECQVGVSEGLLAALLAARAHRLVPTGEAAAFLAPHPIEVLELGAGASQRRRELGELAGVLRRLGLRTLGSLAALAAGDVAARFGTLGLLARTLARGGEAPTSSPRRPEPDVTVRSEPDPPVERTDVAAFVARSLAEELAERLLRRGVTCARLSVLARTEDGEELSRTWRLDAAPSPAELTDRVRWQLEGWLAGRSSRPPSAPLVRLQLTAEEVGPAGAHSAALWGRASRGRVQAERAALRVQGMLGPERVLVPVLQGGRDPSSRTRLVAWGDDPSPLQPLEAPWPGRLPAPEPATVLQEPQVVTLLDAAAKPVTCSARGHLSAPPAALVIASRPATSRSARGGGSHGGAPQPGAQPGPPSGDHRVQAWSGPWPVTEGWWREGGRRRAYLQVLPAGCPALLLALAGGQWHLEAVYD